MIDEMQTMKKDVKGIQWAYVLFIVSGNLFAITFIILAIYSMDRGIAQDSWLPYIVAVLAMTIFTIVLWALNIPFIRRGKMIIDEMDDDFLPKYIKVLLSRIGVGAGYNRASKLRRLQKWETVAYSVSLIVAVISIFAIAWIEPEFAETLPFIGLAILLIVTSLIIIISLVMALRRTTSLIEKARTVDVRCKDL